MSTGLSDETYYVLDGSKIIRETRTGSQTATLYYFYDESGVTGFNYNGSDYYYGKNLQGDITKIYDWFGNEVTSYTYDAWGKIISVSGSLASTVGQANPFRYRSYYYDSETGWYYLNSRYYDPSVGRFINADGIIGANDGLQGYNMFAYCNNNPVMGYDPSGYGFLDFDWAEDAWNWTKEAASDTGEWVSGAANDIADTAVVVWDNTTEWVSNAYDDTTEWVSNAYDDTTEWTSNAYDDTTEWVSTATTDAWNWTKNAAIDTGEWVSNNWKKGVDWAGAVFGLGTGGMAVLTTTGVIAPIPVAGQITVAVVGLGFAVWGIGRLAELW